MGQIWFSNISSLNDPLEVSFGLEVIKDIIESNCTDIKNIQTIIGKLEKELEQKITTKKYFCFFYITRY